LAAILAQRVSRVFQSFSFLHQLGFIVDQMTQKSLVVQTRKSAQRFCRHARLPPIKAQ